MPGDNNRYRFVGGKLMKLNPDGSTSPVGANDTIMGVPANQRPGIGGEPNVDFPSKDFTPSEWAKWGGKTALDAGTLGVQMFAPEEKPLQLLLKSALSGGMTGIRGLLDGEDPSTAAKQAAFTGGLTAVAPGLAKKIPEWGTKLGLITGGGLTRGLKGRIGEFTDAFMNTRKDAPGWTGRPGDIGSGVKIGDNVKIDKLQGKYGDIIERLERAVRGEPVDLNNLRGASTRLQGPEFSGRSDQPVTDRNWYNNKDHEYVNQQIQFRKQPPPATPPPRATPGQMAMVPAGTPNPLPERVSVRENNNLKRARQTQARDLYKARNRHGQPAPGRQELREERWANDMAHAHAGESRPHEEAAGVAPSLDRANARLSDLHKMEDANIALRGGGTTLGDVSLLGVRGGMGAALGRMLSGAIGADPFTGYAAGGLTGLFASPSNLSGTANAVGRFSKAAPWLVTGNRLKNDLNQGKDEVTKKVRRRTPGGK